LKVLATLKAEAPHTKGASNVVTEERLLDHLVTVWTHLELFTLRCIIIKLINMVFA
jgi:hypothetical protein